MQVLKTALALQLASAPTTVLDVKNAKPIHALVRLREQVQDNAAARAEWRKKARTAAVIGSCPRSLQSLDSGDFTYSLHGHLWRCRICLPGISHWRKYIAIAHGDENLDSMSFPPRLEDVLGWSNTFRLPLGDLRALALLLHDCCVALRRQVYRHLWELHELSACRLSASIRTTLRCAASRCTLTILLRMVSKS